MPEDRRTEAAGAEMSEQPAEPSAQGKGGWPHWMTVFVVLLLGLAATGAVQSMQESDSTSPAVPEVVILDEEESEHPTAESAEVPEPEPDQEPEVRPAVEPAEPESVPESKPRPPQGPGDLSVGERKAIFWELAEAEDRAMAEADAVYNPLNPDYENIMANIELNDELYDQYYKEILRRHGITDAVARQIMVEGSQERWPTP